MSAIKKAIYIIAAVLLLIATYILLPGFCKATDAFISDYELSPDGSSMTVTVQVGSSAGYVRKAAIKEQSGGRLYLDCYRAFGGINGSLGAKNLFTLPLKADTEVICIFRNVVCYEAVLAKDSSGNWQRVQ